MTEVGWLTCKKPGRMLKFLRSGASDRRLRLFVAGFWSWQAQYVRDGDQGRLASEILGLR